ncbi:MAG TPA: hypothetical protein ENJ84_10275, partial [Gammaproteobacteria bacterium]|nr:hypothetical protein [Gammaproteobacteria bacterium]
GTRTPTAGQLVHADINQDGQINVADVLLLQKRLLQGWLGIRPPTRVAVAPSRPSATLAWLDWFLTPVQALPNNSGQVYYVHNDQLGTPQVLTDETGAVVWKATYDPFGKATVDEDPDGDGNIVVLNVRFSGQYFDKETGLHQNGFRTYDPETGRYLTSDPIGLGGGLNTYSYVFSNPLRWTDPQGLFVPVIALPFIAGGSTTGLGTAAGIVALLGLVPWAMSNVEIGPWPGSSDISDAEIAGEEAADELSDEEVCMPGNGDNCDKVRRACRQRCIDKWVANTQGGIPQGQASEWTRRCRAACAAKFGCGPDAF